MKIGIISSGIDTLALFKFLPCYDNEYLIYVDQKGFPYEEKSFDFVIDSIKKAGKFLIEKWAEIIIVDPIYELELTRLWEDKKLRILPLFQKYLQDYAFKYSLIWKIGVLTDFSSFQKVQELLENEEKRYKPTQLQKEIKKFNYPFHYRIKPVSSWVYNIYDMWIHNPLL